MVLTEPRALPCCRGTSWLPLGFVALYSACNSQTGLENWLLRRLQGSDAVPALVWGGHLDALSTSPVGTWMANAVISHVGPAWSEAFLALL